MTSPQLTLTARLNTSAVDSRRGVVRLHPNAIAALGIREWDAVSLLPRDLGPGTSTSAATSALAAAVGISWTSELLTVTGVDPAGPVSVQPNSLVTWGTGVPTAVEPSRSTPPVTVNDLTGVSAQ